MKLSEVFARAGIDKDEKARRILNTSKAKASISADEIEAGVTLERLETVGVPVYRYSTQITIHGRLPGFDDDARQAGYKAVFQNGNGTVGVRYVAIDAAKKQAVAEASRLSEKREWSASICSTGLTLAHFSATKEECLAAFKGLRRDLFYGSVIAGAGQMGGFYVLADVGAIPEANLWPFVESLWGFTGPEAVKAANDAREAKWAASREQSQAEQAKATAAADDRRRALAADFPGRRLEKIPAGACTFVRILGGKFTGKAGAYLYTLSKRGPRLCYATQPFPGSGGDKRIKFSALTDPLRARLDEDALNGFVFSAA